MIPVSPAFWCRFDDGVGTEARADVYPGAVEVPDDGVDQDCAGGDLVTGTTGTTDTATTDTGTTDTGTTPPATSTAPTTPPPDRAAAADPPPTPAGCGCGTARIPPTAAGVLPLPLTTRRQSYENRLVCRNRPSGSNRRFIAARRSSVASP